MGKVMVVDDAYSELQVMESILRSAGHDVVTYLDGVQLEEKIATERPDVVLLDIVMPKRNGFEVLRGIRRDERTKQTRVVVVSCKNQESDRAWGLRQGADEYLSKPFTAEQLSTAVRRFIR
jgi:twitching motility two-component system response regulator PilH